MLHRTNTTTLKNLAGKILSVIFPVFSLLFLSFLFVVTIYETCTNDHSSEKTYQLELCKKYGVLQMDDCL